MKTDNKRRKFIKQSFLTTAIILNSGCSQKKITPIETLKIIQEDLFPFIKELKFDTTKYIKIVFLHHKIRDIDKEYLKNGIKWLNEESIKLYHDIYTNLSVQNRQKILKHISKTKWGDSWLFDVMTYLFEAILSDPIYQINKDKRAWKWLNFKGGLPQPMEIYL